MVPSLMIDIGRAAGTDVSYQELVARHEHYSLVVQDGLVYSTSGLLYNIPQDSEPRATLMREVHDAPTGGHLGREKAYARLTAVYWMDSVRRCRDYTSSCVSCAWNFGNQAWLFHVAWQ